ncbi:hypothetical protein PMIN01_08174 [Paraphaeosphaeria minitans]|uniref:DUF7924 domain-containing protein n=1 Tax=Paraphaeosphaeria minitans TaxID=565426 RepID=A0A9P6GEN0_9PLEO|nr:hypothetical protein PMIN01_08174 [Paraphaeosphaeria minitans]
MKRRVSDSDIWQFTRCSACSPKRRKTQPADADAHPAASPPLSNASSRSLTLTDQALHTTHRRIHEKAEALIQHWAEQCAVPEMPAAPPTPRSAPSNDRGRRSVKRHARSRGSRTPSPSKRPSPQTYRTRNMYHAGVLVDKLGDLPPAIDNEVRRILGIETWEDRMPAALDEPQAATHLSGLVSTFWAESQRNARECSLEGDWKASLNSVIRNLADLEAGALKTHMSEKLWNSDLKPTSLSFDESYNEEYSGTCTPRLPPTETAMPDFNPNHAAAAAAAAFSGPIPSLLPYTQSIASTTSTEALDPYHISTPKPDITIGLAHTAFAQSHQRRLVDHQASGSILSDPHAADMGVRFPFLVVEVKGLSSSGSLISGQNQAAISGACMLTILKDLSHQAAWKTLSTSHPTPVLCFSIVTEGPVHELWVHFEQRRIPNGVFAVVAHCTQRRCARARAFSGSDHGLG